MSLHYHGTFEELCRWLAKLEISGAWSAEPNGCKMLRCANCVQIHWSSTRGTIWLTGKPLPRELLMKRLQHALPADHIFAFDDDDEDYDPVSDYYDE